MFIVRDGLILSGPLICWIQTKHAAPGQHGINPLPLTVDAAIHSPPPGFVCATYLETQVEVCQTYLETLVGEQELVGGLKNIIFL